MKSCPKCNFLNKDFAASCGSCGASFGFGRGKKSKDSKINPYAKYSLILGIVSLPFIYCCLGWIPGAIAVVFGLVARYRIKKSQDTQTGSVVALVGIILGLVSVGAAVALLIYTFVGQNSSISEFWQNIDTQLKESGNN